MRRRRRQYQMNSALEVVKFRIEYKKESEKETIWRLGRLPGCSAPHTHMLRPHTHMPDTAYPYPRHRIPYAYAPHTLRICTACPYVYAPHRICDAAHSICYAPHRICSRSIPICSRGIPKCHAPTDLLWLTAYSYACGRIPVNSRSMPICSGSIV